MVCHLHYYKTSSSFVSRLRSGASVRTSLRPVIAMVEARRQGALWAVELFSLRRWLEIAEDADVGELFAVAVRGKRQQEGPLQAHQAPHTRQEQAVWVQQ